MCGYNRRLNLMEATQMMRNMDSNFDGRANKFELFRAFKSMIANSNSMNMGGNNYNNSWNPNYQGNQGGYGGMGGGIGGSFGFGNNMGGGFRGGW
jgi:hypothetical protein